MKIVNPIDRELDEAFATNVAGWRRDPGYDGKWIPVGKPALSGGNYYTAKPPAFTQSADAVLPYVSKSKEVGIHYLDGDWYVRLWSEDKNCANCDSLAKACVIALLRANGVEVEFTE